MHLAEMSPHENRTSDASTVTAVDPDAEADRLTDVDLEAQDPELVLERVWSRTSQREAAIANGADPKKTPAAKDEVEKDEDLFLVTLKGREHINPHTWGVKYRWFLTIFAGILVLNCSKSGCCCTWLGAVVVVRLGGGDEGGGRGGRGSVLPRLGRGNERRR